MWVRTDGDQLVNIARLGGVVRDDNEIRGYASNENDIFLLARYRTVDDACDAFEDLASALRRGEPYCDIDPAGTPVIEREREGGDQ